MNWNHLIYLIICVKSLLFSNSFDITPYKGAYSKKELTLNFFEGEVDVDLDLQILLPMTQAQMATMWSQILRDAVPFIQAGVIDISLKKTFENYIEAMGINPNSLKEDKEALSLEMAEAEHNLFKDKNTSKGMKEILPNGTQAPYLTAGHLLKHNEFLDGDIHIEDSEKVRLLEHIKLDIEGLKKINYRSFND